MTILEATLELIPKPPCVSLLAVGYPDKFRTADHVTIAREHEPISIEGMDGTLIEDMTLLGIHQHERSMLPDGRGWLLVEFGGETKEESDAKARALMRDLEKDGQPPSGMKLYDDPDSEQHIWEVREAGLGATAFIPGKEDTHEGWEDSAVPPERLGEYLRRLSKLAERYGYESSLYGHYGQGCVHARWNFDLVTKPGIAKFRRCARGRERPRARARRLAVRGARRRPVARGAAAEDVRRRARPRVRGVQVDLGSRLEDEPGQGRPAVPRRREPPAGRQLRAVAAEGQVRLPARPRRLRARDRPLCRRRQVPHAQRGRRHVPVVHGDARGDALDPRPHASPLRDARRRGHHRRLAVGRGDGGARPLPRVQGLHERLPGQRRHAHLQGGVPPPPLEAQAPPAPRLRVRADRPGRPARVAGARARQLRHAHAAVRAGLQARRRDDAGAGGPRVRAADPPAVVQAASAGRRTRPGGRSSSSRTRSTTTCTRTSASRR